MSGSKTLTKIAGGLRQLISHQGMTMKSDILSLILGMYVLGAIAFEARNWRSWLVLLIGVFIACMGAWGGYEFTIRSQPSGNLLAGYFGQVLVVFASVIGGALVGTAFTELRAKSKAVGDG